MINPAHTSLGQAFPALTHQTATLVAGAATIADMALRNANVFFQRIVAGGAPGFLTQGATTEGNPGSLALASNNGADVGTIRAYSFNGGRATTGGGDTVRRNEARGASGSRIGGTSEGMVCRETVLVAGTKTLTPADFGLTAFAARHRAIVQRKTAGGVLGWLQAVLTVGANLVITSSDIGDTSTLTVGIVDVLAMNAYALPGHTGLGGSTPALQVAAGVLVAGTVTLPNIRVPVTVREPVCWCNAPCSAAPPGHLTVSGSAGGNPGTVTITSSNVGDTSSVSLLYFDRSYFGSIT